MLVTQTYIGKLIVETCCDCGIHFGIDSDLYHRRRNDHKGFFCPNGHEQYYSGKSEAEKLKDQLKRQEETAEYLREANDNLHTQLTNEKYRSRAQKAAKTRIMNRVKKGVCPCCNRTFANLQEHFKSKHPELL